MSVTPSVMPFSACHLTLFFYAFLAILEHSPLCIHGCCCFGVFFGHLFQGTAEKMTTLCRALPENVPSIGACKTLGLSDFLKNVSVLGEISIRAIALPFPSPVRTLWAILFSFQWCPHLRLSPRVFLSEWATVAFIVSHLAAPLLNGPWDTWVSVNHSLCSKPHEQNLQQW